MTGKRAAMVLGTGLAMTWLLAAGACREAKETEEPEPFHFMLDTPPDGASDVDPGVLLHWAIYKSMNLVDLDAALLFGPTQPPPFLKMVKYRDSGYCRPGPLKLNQTYYWRLTISTPPGASEVQSFTVNRDRTVWTFQLAPGVSVQDVPGLPIVLGNRVFQRNENGIFHCLDAASGNLLWTFDANQPGSPAPMPPAPVEKIYYNSGRIYCLNAASGALLWSAAPANSHLGFAFPVALGDRVFAFTNERISCLDAATGSEAWGSNRALCWSLCAENGRVYVTTRDAGGSNFLECLDAQTGATLWSKDFGSQSSPSKAAADAQRVFIGQGNRFYCLDARDGAQIWEYVTDEYAENPFAFDGKVLLATKQDRYMLLDASNKEQIWQTELLETPGRDHYTRRNGDPVLVNGSLVLADMSGYIYCLDTTNGGYTWKYFVSTDLLGVAAFGDRIYVTGDDEILHCLDTK